MDGELGVWFKGSPGLSDPIGLVPVGGDLTSCPGCGAPLTIESIESAILGGKGVVIGLVRLALPCLA